MTADTQRGPTPTHHPPVGQRHRGCVLPCLSDGEVVGEDEAVHHTAARQYISAVGLGGQTCISRTQVVLQLSQLGLWLQLLPPQGGHHQHLR
jgi:hypothetical protein